MTESPIFNHCLIYQVFFRINSSPHCTLPNDYYDAPDEMCGKTNYLIALLPNEARNKFLISGPRLSVAKLRPLSFTVARWRCLYHIFSSCNVKFSSWKGLISFQEKMNVFGLYLISSHNFFFYLFKFISYQRMVCSDPNCGNIYYNCSNVCEVASGLLIPRGQHNWTEIQFLHN